MFLLSRVKTSGRIFQIFVAFSEKLHFKGTSIKDVRRFSTISHPPPSLKSNMNNGLNLESNIYCLKILAFFTTFVILLSKYLSIYVLRLNFTPCLILQGVQSVLLAKSQTSFWPRFYIVDLGMTFFFFSFSNLLFPIFIWAFLSLFYLDFYSFKIPFKFVILFKFILNSF